ncbi:hypothetical protein DRO97_00970 [Archaeoglobales archaeon]|nr:MAG: hypothetical protein DRO97_00970 [Archaeoglobales archaeon]
MKYKIVKIELKEDNLVVLWLKKVSSNATVMPKIDNLFSDPAKLIEFGKHVSMSYAKAIEELMQFDAYFTIDYDEYNLRDLRVGDIVEIEIKQIEK